MESKQFLPNYTYAGTGKMTDYLNNVGDVADNYDYIVVISPTLLNYICFYFENDLENYTSTYGILTKCDEIVDYFNKNRKFPKILILNDIICDGAETAKCIGLLETYLFERLHNKYTINFLRRAFADCVTIMAFARNKHTIFLEDRFANKLITSVEDYKNQLNEISAQMSDVLPRWGFELATFSPAIISDKLKSTLIGKTKDEHSFNNNWKINSLDYYEKMIFAYRLYSNKHISSIRMFPNRGKSESSGKPWITSHTILGYMENDTVNKICNLICNTFNWNENTPLGKILLSDKRDFLHAKHYLLNLLISMFDLIEFINDNELIDINIQETNLEKISKMFDTDYPKVLKQLNEIINNSSLVLKLKQEIDLIISQKSSKIIDESTFNEIRNTKSNAEFNNNVIIDDIQKIIWLMSMNQQNRFFITRDKPYLFYPTSYQDYEEYTYLQLRIIDCNPNGSIFTEKYMDYGKNSNNDKDRYGRDGVITFYNLIDLLKHQCKENNRDFYSLFPFYLAAYFMLEDLGMVKSTIQISSLTDSFVPLVATTVLSENYFPKKIAWFLNGLSSIESRYYRISNNELSSVTMFYDFAKKIIIDKKSEIIESLNLPEEEREYYDSYYDAYIKSLPDTKEFSEFYALMMKSGLSFRGFSNNQSLKYPNYKFVSKINKYIRLMAYDILGIEKEDEEDKKMMESIRKNLILRKINR